jgi:glycogen(starch) synthase
MIRKLLIDEELRGRLAAEASEHVLRFDWADVARQTLALYEELARFAVAPARGRS